MKIQLREPVIEEIDNEDELNAFFDEVNEAISQKHGNLTRLEFFISKHDTYPSTTSSSRKEQLSSTSFSHSKID